MAEEYKIISGNKEEIFTDEITERKSRFIAYIKKVESEDEATTFWKWGSERSNSGNALFWRNITRR